MAPQFSWQLQRTCLCVNDLWRRGDNSVCRGGVRMSDLWFIMAFAVCTKKTSAKSVKQEFPTRVSNKSVPQVCQVRRSHKSVK